MATKNKTGEVANRRRGCPVVGAHRAIHYIRSARRYLLVCTAVCMYRIYLGQSTSVIAATCQTKFIYRYMFVSLITRLAYLIRIPLPPMTIRRSIAEESIGLTINLF